jgi:hypothetical protein
MSCLSRRRQVVNKDVWKDKISQPIYLVDQAATFKYLSFDDDDGRFLACEDCGKVRV